MSICDVPHTSRTHCSGIVEISRQWSPQVQTRQRRQTQSLLSPGSSPSLWRPHKQNALTGQSLVGNFQWKDVLIPDNVGRGTVKWWYQRRTLIQYAAMASAGLYTFYTSSSPSLRAAGLGLLFPGAGLISVCTIPSILAFIISTAAIPACLFAWFGAGGVAFPMFLWASTTALAAFLAKESLLEIAAPLWTAICVVGIAYITQTTSTANKEASQKREERNKYLVESVQKSQASAKLPQPGSRELSLRNLRFLQWEIELGLAGKDDFSHHDIIDQFQTSAIRYQLYGAQNDLGVYQFAYAPNFHGYLSQAQRNCIEKSLTEKVVGFWKWESMWGKFNAHDWDPCVKDNIMVSGYVAQAVGIYQSNTGDERYMKPGSLTFHVSKNGIYEYDFRKIAVALERNFKEAAYCLFPCEPNWIYTMCNLVGISGMILADRLMDMPYARQVKQRFENALEEEFTTQDGTILPIRSELTGFTNTKIPGLAGALADGVNSILCAAYLPHIAHRNWAFTKNESIKFNKKGEIELQNLVGADKIDAGNYKAGEGSIRATFAASATEFGDEKIAKELLRQLDEEYHPVMETKTGALKNRGLSTLSQGAATRARIGGFQDWVNMITKGPEESTKRGPILDKVSYPEVLVAKCYSHDGVGLDIVLYPGRDAGTFDLGFTRLRPGSKYSLGGQTKVAGRDGTADFAVKVDGRTQLELTLQK
ncbi:hypothetical protein BU24DRAFT_448263 [Aaosphaeria arxii CBS 175.79]|uniref:Linalool dehydratase/isomerase domain-containing protein n=1 Tax=Aaosphaeria arxii CBS 175.79 TaxID=1450172 RepID=A0A6A5Y507_9PLEO|nr:uncharacterized protein BU24DRAFT_448263 [Aaosphaeria arxii CBS 175.79]KAF2019870.1 hypothetical protein BU24DRAFT_448263 [Aaosphaeria arxii CBS 175.79]